MDRPFTDIVVPLDGSPAAEQALGPALELVRRTGAPLRVPSRILADDKEELTTHLAGVTDRHAAITDVETEVIDHESIPDAITDGLGPGSLVCLSSHGWGGLMRATMGSITQARLRMLDRPALVVGPHAGGATLRGRRSPRWTAPGSRSVSSPPHWPGARCCTSRSGWSRWPSRRTR